MAGFILKLLNAEIGFEDGMVLIGRTKDDMEVSWQRYSIAKTEIIHSPDSNEKEIRILKNVAETIASSSKGALPKEAGGGLIGRISESLQCITVTSTIPPPADSTSSRCSFVLGTEGLAGFVKKILTESRGELSYLGTWHSHPLGGGPSIIDNTTKTTLVDLRAPEPTVCLLYSGNSFTCI